MKLAAACKHQTPNTKLQRSLKLQAPNGAGARTFLSAFQRNHTLERKRIFGLIRLWHRRRRAARRAAASLSARVLSELSEAHRAGHPAAGHRPAVSQQQRSADILVRPKMRTRSMADRNVRAPLMLAACCLELLWSLVLGIWCLRRSRKSDIAPHENC
jgi:hypothetical protein